MLGSLGSWLSEPANASGWAIISPRCCRGSQARYRRNRSARSVGRLAQQALETIPAAPLASKMLAVIWAQGEAQAFLAHAIEYSETWIADNKAYLTRKISQQSSRWIPEMDRQDSSRKRCSTAC